MKKRIISLLIALSTVITLFVPSAVVHAELGIKNELQVSLGSIKYRTRISFFI